MLKRLLKTSFTVIVIAILAGCGSGGLEDSNNEGDYEDIEYENEQIQLDGDSDSSEEYYEIDGAEMDERFDNVDDADYTDANDSTDDEYPWYIPANCPTLEVGLNTGFMVDGEARQFILTLPRNVETNGPWPVIFNWHGYGDTAQNMNYLLSSYVNNTTMPFILVTPDDTNLPLPNGVDWDILNVSEPNKEARLFEDVMGCLAQQFGVDSRQIHSVGFSAGAIATDMLGVMRGDMLASIVTYSGGYFSNPVNDNNFTNWPPLTTTNGYTQLIMHGGTTSDTWNAVVIVINFGQMALEDSNYLNGLGHDIIICDHGLGHDIPTEIRASELIEFFYDHPYGTENSPYAYGLPNSFPGYCDFQEKD